MSDASRATSADGTANAPGEMRGLGATDIMIVPKDTFHFLPRLKKKNVLRSVSEISLYLFERDTPKCRRATFHILASSNSVPAFKVAGVWHLDIATLNAKLWVAETKGWSERDKQLGRLHVVLFGLLLRLNATSSEGQVDAETGAYLEQAVREIRSILNH